VGLVLAALSLVAVFTLSLPDDTLWLRVIANAGHGPVFGALAIVLLLLQAPPAGLQLRAFSQYRAVFLVVVVLGIVTELLQLALPNRSVSAADALRDAAGAALGLALVWLVERRLARQLEGYAGDARTPVAVAVALGACVILAWQPLQAARAYAARTAAWPALLPLNAEAQAAFTRVNDATVSHAPLPVDFRQSGDADSLRLSFNAGARPGVQLLEPVADWSSHEQLVIDVTNPASQPVQLVLRVFDATHDWTHEDRFNQALVIPARTRTTVRIALEAVATSPHGRRMDMTAIADVMLFASRPQDAGELYLTRVWLE
jgi:hypothetical protein